MIIALLGLSISAFTVVSKPNADSIDFSQVYQYYLLSDTNGNDAKASTSNSGSNSSDGSSGKAAGKLVGLLGNGGNQGTFSYSDIIQGSADKGQARKFSKIMATLSGYNYISVQSNGVEKVGSIVGHGIVGIFLIIIGFITDVTNLFWSMIVNVIAQYNIFNVLGSAFGASKTGDQMAKALGISSNDIKNWISFGITIFTAVILFTLVRMLRNGGENISREDSHKFIGRIIGLLGIPVVVTMVCMVLSDVTAMTPGGNPSEDPVYANWLMDVETWAKRDNFNIKDGDINKEIDTSAISNGNYVDNKFNPYAASQPASKIGQSLYANGLGQGKSKFPNSTIAMGYLTSQTFDSRDYLDYLANNDINRLVQQFPDKYLYDFDNSYTSSGEKANWKDGAAGMKKAKSDYGNLSDGQVKDRNASKIKTWEDRYIFGAKNNGDLKDYYMQQPSNEQIYSKRGGSLNSNDQLTDESMFLVLSTKFDTEGGDFALDGPTYGAYATISKFDSNRYSYYTYSMVGKPIYTIPAMTVQGLMNLLVGLGIIGALWSVSIIEMNLKPFRSWIKSITFGDIEYTEATLVYGLGIAATALTITLIPNALVQLFVAIANSIGKLFIGNGNDLTSGSVNVNQSEILGCSYWAGFVFAVAGVIFFWKNYFGFRDKLIEMLTIPWEWASSKGQALEDMVNDGHVANGRAKTRGKLRNRRERTNNALEALQRNTNPIAKSLNNITGGKAGDLAEQTLLNRTKHGDYALDIRPDGIHSDRELTMDEIKRRGNLRRMGNAIADLKSNTENPAALANAFDQHAKAADGLSDGNIIGPDGKLNTENPFVDAGDKAAMEGINGLMDDAGARNEQLQSLVNAGANGLTPAEAKDLDALHKQEDEDLGPDDANDYRALQQKIAQGEPLTPEEQQRLDGYNQQLKEAQEARERNVLGDQGFDDYQDLKKKVANGEELTPEEQQRLNGYRSKLKQNGVDPDALAKMQSLERKAAPLLDSQETDELNDLQGQAGKILGEDGMQEYQKLEDKYANGEELTPEERKKLGDYHKKLTDGGMARSQVRRLENLESKGSNGLSVTDSRRYQNLIHAAAKVPGMNPQRVRDFVKLSKQAADGTISPAGKQRLAKYTDTLHKGKMKTKQIEELKKLATKHQAGHLNPAELTRMKELQAKQALSQQGAMNLSTAQKSKLARINMARDDAFKRANPTGYQTLMKYRNMHGNLSEPQLKEFQSLQAELNKVANENLDPTMKREYQRLNHLRFPTMKDGTSSQMTAGEKAQLRSLTDKAARNLNRGQQRRMRTLETELNRTANDIGNKKSNMLNKLQNEKHIQASKAKVVAEAQAQANQLTKIRQAYGTFARRGGSPEDASRIVDLFNHEISTTTDKAYRKQLQKAGQTVFDQLNQYDFSTRGNADINGDGRVDLNDTGELLGRSNDAKGMEGLQRNLNQLSKNLHDIDD